MADAAILNLLHIATNTYTNAIGMFARAAGTEINRCGKRFSGGTRQSVGSRRYVSGPYSAFRKMVEHIRTAGCKTFASHECAYLLTYCGHMIRAQPRWVLRDGKARRREKSPTFRRQGIQDVRYLNQRSGQIHTEKYRHTHFEVRNSVKCRQPCQCSFECHFLGVVLHTDPSADSVMTENEALQVRRPTLPG